MDDNGGLRLSAAKSSIVFSSSVSNNRNSLNRLKAEHIATILKQISWKFLAAAEKPIS